MSDLVAGGTLLKITDFPFAYSSIAILFSILSIELSEQYLMFLTIAGFTASFLVLVDPVGKIIKYTIMGFVKLNLKFNKKFEYWKGRKFSSDWVYLNSAFHTKAISFENDKLVSMLYFLFTVAIFNSAIEDYESFAKKFTFGNIENSESLLSISPQITNFDVSSFACNVDCVQSTVNGIFPYVDIVIIGVIVFNLINYLGKIDSISVYLQGIGSRYTTENSRSNLSHYIEQADWQTAQFWTDIMKKEIKNETNLSESRKTKFDSHISLILSNFYDSIRKPETLGDTTDDVIWKFENNEFKKNFISHLSTDPNTRLFYYEFWRFKSLEKELDTVYNESVKISNKEYDELFNILKQKDNFDSDGVRFKNQSTLEIYQINSLSESLRRFILENEINIQTTKQDTGLTNIVITGGSIAQLREDNAEELIYYLEKLKKKYAELGKETQTKIRELVELKKLIAKKLTTIAIDSNVLGSPLKGFCDSCLNESFHTQNFIDENKNYLNLIDWDLLSYEKKHHFDERSY